MHADQHLEGSFAPKSSPRAEAEASLSGPVAAATDVKSGSAVAELTLSKERVVSELTRCQPFLKFPPSCDEHMVGEDTQLQEDSVLRPLNNNAPGNNFLNVETAEGTELHPICAM